MSEQASNSFVIIAMIIGFLPGIYFAWMVIKGIILSLRKSRDDEF
jgi:hypothetical protein